VYARWVPRDRNHQDQPLVLGTLETRANAFLAQRISSINSISGAVRSTGADVDEVANAIGKDSRHRPENS